MRHRPIAELLGRERLVHVEGETSVREACQIMSVTGASGLAVTRGGDLLGLFGPTDAAARVIALGRDPDRTTLAEVVTHASPTVSPEASAEEVALLMLDSRSQQMAVLSGAEVVGLVSLRCLLQALADNTQGCIPRAAVPGPAANATSP